MRQVLEISGYAHLSPGTVFMLGLSCFLLFLGIRKRFEPLLLVPIAFGMLLANIPGGDMLSHSKQDLQQRQAQHLLAEDASCGPMQIFRSKDGHIETVLREDGSLHVFTDGNGDSFVLKDAELIHLNGRITRRIVHKTDIIEEIAYTANGQTRITERPYRKEKNDEGILYLLYRALIKTGILPPLIFMGVGAMTDFAPLLRNLKLAMFGASAQIGIFAVLLGSLSTGIFTIPEAASLGIIGGADGPTAIFLTSKLAPHLLGPIAVAAYSYMALVPLIVPLMAALLMNEADFSIHMRNQDKRRGRGASTKVSKRAKIVFPVMLTLVSCLMVPSATPLLGMLMFGNLIKECAVPEVVDRLAGTAGNALINICTIFLGLTVGATMDAVTFLNVKTLGIIAGGFFAFAISIAGGILSAKAYNRIARMKHWKLVNPLIGATGLSAVPMASRVANELSLKKDPSNNILQYCMASNISGVIGSAIAAGVLLAILG